MASPPCCPPQILPAATAAEIGATAPLKGKEIVLGNKARTYVVEPNPDMLGADGKPKAAVIVFHDIFGYNSGRTHHICDELAAAGGFLVLAPDFFGESILTEPSDFLSLSFFSKILAMKNRASVQYPTVEKKLVDLILPFVKERTNGKIGAMGFCWGAWPIARAAGKGAYLACGVGAHPNFHMQMMQSSGPTMDEMFKEIQVPMLLCPAWNDPSSMREGGYYMNILKKSPTKANKSKSVLFSSQLHGFANRSNLNVAQNRQDHEKFIKLSLAFLQEHLLDENPSSSTSTSGLHVNSTSAHL